MLKGIVRRFLRFAPSIICGVVFAILGFWLLTPQDVSFASGGYPCRSIGTCGGVDTHPEDCANRIPYCGGSCGISCASGAADSFCVGSNPDGCNYRMVNCNPILKYKCHGGAFEPPHCVCSGDESGYCMLQQCY